MLPAAVRARERGVLFDVGHGVGSFAYRVARARAGPGVRPDTISSDLHAHNVDGPVFDQATTLSKLLHVGMPLADVIAATTSTPAAAVRRAGRIGALAARPGRPTFPSSSCGHGHWPLPDAAGATEVVERLLVPRMVIRAGQVRELAGRPSPAPRRAALGWPAVNISAVTGGTVVTPGGLARRRADPRREDRGDRDHAAGRGPGPGRVGLLRAARRSRPALPSDGRGPGLATAAAARGGTTTVLSFTSPAAGERDLDALLRGRAELDRDGAMVDVGLHAAIYDPGQPQL